MIDSDIRGWIVEYPKGKMWKTPNGKFFWTTSGAAKNAFSCHYGYFGPEGYRLSYQARQDQLKEAKREANFIVVKLKAVQE